VRVRDAKRTWLKDSPAMLALDVIVDRIIVHLTTVAMH